MNENAEKLLERAKRRGRRVIFPNREMVEQGFAALQDMGVEPGQIHSFSSDTGIPVGDIACFFAPVPAAFAPHSEEPEEASSSDCLKGIEAKIDDIHRLLLDQHSAGLHKEWYSVTEAANLTGFKPYTIRQCCNLGRMQDTWTTKDVRTGKWRISVEAVRWIQNHGLPPA